MLTARKMFSVSFTASAVAAEETGTTRTTKARYSASATRSASGPSPPTTFGMRSVVKSSLPGSSRSGEYARKKSRPDRSPPRSRIGRMISVVVPG